ncbi:MAG: 2-phosphosulfolactate phosphatase family protein [Flammeovirgaceae bacterium]
MKVEVCFSPALINLYELKRKTVVVVDILRATSCMVAGLGSGIKRIVPVAEKEAVIPYKNQGFLTAGERNGDKIEGFDMGNSPFEFISDKCKGRSVVMTTTNGTQAIHHSKNADKILIGSFLNLSSIAQKLLSEQQDVVIHCAGWKNRYSLEDSLFAGALLDVLGNKVEIACDAALSSKTIYQAVKNHLIDFVMNSSHAKRLEKLQNHENDIIYCLSQDKFDIIPVLKGEFLEI